MSDLETQTFSQSAEQYGAIESSPKKGLDETPDKLPLLLGRWAVAPETLYRVGFGAYVAWFVIHRAVDIFYILTVDARFPEGLGHLYPSEAQRLESVAYTKQVLFCSMLHRCVVFTVVVAFIYFGLFARFDQALRSFFGGIATWWENSRIRAFFVACFTPVWEYVLAPIGRTPPMAWLGTFLKDHVWNGRLLTDLNNRFGFPLSIGELLLGALYLSLLGALFFLLGSPFMYWQQWIDIKYGFANSLSVNLSNFRLRVGLTVISMIFSAIPQKFAFLAVLQYRLGWVFMWAGMFLGILYAQHNVAMIAPMMGLDTKFPSASFAVGRGFPLVETPSTWAPWISLNRIFWPDKYSPQYLLAEKSLGDASPKTWYTDDKSKGQLALKNTGGKWQLSGTAWFDPTAKVYAESKGADMQSASWTIGDEQTHIGLRSGKELRDKLYGFAGERHIGVGQIYMVDGSHKDARANAFVTGAGNHSIIGLYDTLFLGKRGKEASEDDDEDQLEVAQSESMVQHVSEVIQDVDVEKDDRDSKAPRNSAPTQAMNDDEIVAILAHELAHSAMRHMEMGMAAQVVTSFMTFGAMGFMAHSPLAAAALSLTAPLVHVGSCAYDHVVGPTLEGVLKIFTDALTRHNEYQADEYAALISERYGNGLQTALAKLSVNSNQDPDPPHFWEALHADHPTFARRWAHIERAKIKAYGKKKAIGN